MYFAGKALYWGDTELYFAPMQHFLRGWLARGVIPLWNPEILCGQPFVGNPQTWPLYPSQLLATRCSEWTFLTVSDGIHLLLGGGWMFLLARQQPLGRASSMLAGLVFMLGGFFASKTQFPNMCQAIAWTPAALFLAGRLAKRPGLRLAIPFGVVLGLQLLSAHAQIALMTIYFAALYAVYHAWAQLRAGSVDWRRVVGWAVFAGGFAALLGGGQLLPVLELWRHSDRQTLTLSIANRFVLMGEQCTNFFWPNRFGSPYAGNYNELGNYWESACYLGIAPCLLLLAGAYDGLARRAGRPVFWLIVFLVSVWLAQGRTAGLYAAAYYVVPGVRAFHDPARMLLGASIAAPMLAGYGLQWLAGLRPIQTPGARIAVAAAVLLATTIDLAHYDGQLYPVLPVAALEADIRAAAARDSSLALPGHRLEFPPEERTAWHFFADYETYRRSDEGYFPALLRSHITDSSMLEDLSDAGGYEPEPVKDTVARSIDAARRQIVGDDSRIDPLCVDSVLALPPRRMPDTPSYFAVHERVVWANPRRERITRARIMPQGTYLAVRDDGPDRVLVSVPPHTVAEQIVLADTAMPGWIASIGDAPLAIQSTGIGFRAVVAPAGAAGDLAFTYRPATLLVGLYLTLASLAFALGFGAYAVLFPN